jgi:hypothetical protein
MVTSVAVLEVKRPISLVPDFVYVLRSSCGLDSPCVNAISFFFSSVYLKIPSVDSLASQGCSVIADDYGFIKQQRNTTQVVKSY